MSGKAVLLLQRMNQWTS